MRPNLVSLGASRKRRQYLGILLILALSVCDAFAQVGESVEACNQKYGRHIGDLRRLNDVETTARVVGRYQWQGYLMDAYFGGRRVIDMHCVCLHFGKGGQLTDKEIASLLASHAGGSSWIAIQHEYGAQDYWKRADNRAIATTANGKNGMLQIFTPDYYKKNTQDRLPTVFQFLPPELRPK